MYLRTRTAAIAVALASGVGAAMPQQPVGPSASSPSASGALTYRSAFEGYRAFTEQPVQPWSESNATVGRIGGWQSYAREGQGGPVAGSVPRPEDKGMGNLPGMSGMDADKGGMKMPGNAKGTPAPMSPAARTPGPARAPGSVAPSGSVRPASGAAALPGSHTEPKQP